MSDTQLAAQAPVESSDVGDSPAVAASRAFIQTAVFVISATFVAWSVAGLIANPDFSTGADATSRAVLGVDFNGWHAASGLALFGPGLVAARRRDWAVLFAVAAFGALMATGAWALVEKRPLDVLYFKHHSVDAAMHLSSGLAYGVALLLERRRTAGVG